MTINKLHLAMVAAALATAALIWFAPQGDSDLSEPAKEGKLKLTAAGSRSTALVASESAAENLFAVSPDSSSRPSLTDDAAAGLLAKSSWYVARPAPPPPPPPLPPPPPPPSAPPLPFVFLGKYTEGDLNLVIMTFGSRVITASVGEVIDKTYRVERIEPSNVVLTYLPLGSSQSLSTGGPQ